MGGRGRVTGLIDWDKRPIASISRNLHLQPFFSFTYPAAEGGVAQNLVGDFLKEDFGKPNAWQKKTSFGSPWCWSGTLVVTIWPFPTKILTNCFLVPFLLDVQGYCWWFRNPAFTSWSWYIPNGGFLAGFLVAIQQYHPMFRRKSKVPASIPTSRDFEDKTPKLDKRQRTIMQACWSVVGTHPRNGLGFGVEGVEQPGSVREFFYTVFMLGMGWMWWDVQEFLNGKDILIVEWFFTNGSLADPSLSWRYSFELHRCQLEGSYILWLY